MKTSKKKTQSRAKKKSYEHHPDHFNTSENYLIQDLEEELKEAWTKVRKFGASLGEQRSV